MIRGERRGGGGTGRRSKLKTSVYCINHENNNIVDGWMMIAKLLAWPQVGGVSEDVLFHPEMLHFP